LSQNNARFGINAFVLKSIAIVTMLTDHVGAGLYPSQLWMRAVGRLAFPIFAFLLCEGYFHTRSVKRYAIRLGVFALISEIPFDLLHGGKLFDAGYQNIFFTLLISLLTMYFMDRYGRGVTNVSRTGITNVSRVGTTNVSRFGPIDANRAGSDLIRKTLIILSGMFLAEFIHADYGAFGVAVIMIYFMLRDRRTLALACVIAANLLYGLLSALLGDLPIQAFAGFAAIPIFFYNGEKGHSLKYAFYVFYPLHIAAITAVKYFL